MRAFFLFIFLLISANASAQFTDRYWVFGDRAGIDFSNLNNPLAANSIIRTRGTCASISDSSGNLLFYCGSPNWYRWMHGIYSNCLGYAINNQHTIIPNGDSLNGSGWYQEMAIIPAPNSQNEFYIFSVGVTSSNHGFYYSKLDLNQNGGTGYMVQKNIQLQTDTIADCIATVRHGNGRDWWVVVRKWRAAKRYDEIYVYLVDPNGITQMPVQHIGGPLFSSGINRMKFSKNGEHLYNVSPYGNIHRYDFDRCNGQFLNAIFYADSAEIHVGYLDFDVSASESKIYLSLSYQSFGMGYIIQFDLTDTANFLTSCDTIGTYYPDIVPGAVKRGPDDKIYVTGLYQFGDTCFDYLFCASSIFPENTHIGVAPYPDSTGVACGFQPLNFSLGTHKAYWGLPNNPNYELDTLHGSPCDTLTSVGLQDISPPKPSLHLYYHPEFQTLYVNADQLMGKKGVVEFYTSGGQLIETIETPVRGGYLTNSSSFALQPSGTYLVKVRTERERLSGKFVK